MLYIKADALITTQLTAKELATEFAGQDFCVQAQTQTGGRGRYDRHWDSKAGGLYISLLLHPKTDIARMGDLSLKTGRIVAAALEQCFDIKTKIKLPNDVLALYNGEYKKISGILIETSSTAAALNWIIVGIGVNLNNALNKALPATSVSKITGRKVDMEVFKQKLLSNFLSEYNIWQH